MRNVIRIAVLAAGMALASGAAHADLLGWHFPFGGGLGEGGHGFGGGDRDGGHHERGGAPAPLLAAGIPAFFALGGGAAVARLVRRRKV